MRIDTIRCSWSNIGDMARSFRLGDVGGVVCEYEYEYGFPTATPPQTS